MKEHEQYLLDVIQGRRPFKNPNPKLGEGKYYYLDPNQEYDPMAPVRPDQKTYVPSEDSPNPYLQPQPPVQHFQQQAPFQGYTSASDSIPNAAAGGIQPTPSYGNAQRLYGRSKRTLVSRDSDISELSGR